MKILILCLVLVAFVEKSQNEFIKPKHRIINGVTLNNMDADMFDLSQAQVKLRIKRLGTDVIGGCGGSVISSYFVLTAAHCMHDIVLNQMTRQYDDRMVEYVDVYFGCTQTIEFWLQQTENRRVFRENIFIHDQWDPRENGNDLALIQLIQPVFQEIGKIRCISLPDDNICGLNLNQLTISGWGRIEGMQQTEDLRAAHVNVQRHEICRDSYRVNRYNADIHICLMGTQREKACRGDSGGPAAFNDPRQNYKQFIIGVSSFGPEDCEGTIPSVYSSVCAYENWIHRIMRESNQPNPNVCLEAPIRNRG